MPKGTRNVIGHMTKDLGPVRTTRKKEEKKTFSNNYDVRDRNLKPLEICSTVRKRQKLRENNIVETTLKEKGLNYIRFFYNNGFAS